MEQTPAQPPEASGPAETLPEQPAATPAPADLSAVPSEPAFGPKPARALALPGAICLLASLLLYAWLAHVPAEHGWQLRRWSNPTFSGEPSVQSIVVEPFEKEQTTQPFSAEWQSWIRVGEPRRYEFGVEADDQVELWIDERKALDVRGARPRGNPHTAIVRLTSGVHSVRLRLTDFGGGKYLRLFYNTPDQSHGWMEVPFPRRMAWPSKEAAEAARPGLGDGARTALFGLSMLLALLGVALLLLARARRKGLAPDRRDLALGLAVVLVAIAVRAWGLPKADVHWDEFAYLRAGMHHVRALQLGDLEPQTFRWNAEHLPISKWMYGLAEFAGGVSGAKLFSAFLQALSCLFVFLLGRRYASRLVGAGAGLILALLPYFVAHGRIVGLESTLTFFTMLSAWLLALACERQSWRLHLAWGFTSVLGIGARENGVWFGPVAIVFCAVAWARGARRIKPYLASILGALLAVALIAAVWPWIWDDAKGHLLRSYGHWGYRGEEWVLGIKRAPPPWYFPFAFALTVPTGIAALVLAWMAAAVRRHNRYDLLVLLLLVLPFGQSISTFRQDGARYVIQAFPALALAAAWGAESIAGWLRRPRAGVWLLSGTCAYLMALLVWMHPYELDYYAEWAGGPKGVAAKRWLEIPFWGEGERELADAVGKIAPVGARVRLKLMPIDDFPGLRPDLVRTESESAEYLLMNHFQFPDEPKGFELLHEVKAGNARIAGVYRRKETSSGPLRMPGPKRFPAAVGAP